MEHYTNALISRRSYQLRTIPILVARTLQELLSAPHHHRHATPAEFTVRTVCGPPDLPVRRLTAHRLGRALRSPTAGSDGSLAWPLSDRRGLPRRVVARAATRSPLAGCASDLSARELTSLTTSGTSGSMRKAVRLKPRLARPIGQRRTTAVIKLAPELLIAVAAFGIPASYYSRGSHPPH
jgi:hypothetical protein